MMTILHVLVLECTYTLAFQTINTKPSNTNYFFIDNAMTTQLTGSSDKMYCLNYLRVQKTMRMQKKKKTHKYNQI